MRMASLDQPFAADSFGGCPTPSMANPADKVTFNPRPILVGVAWGLAAKLAITLPTR